MGQTSKHPLGHYTNRSLKSKEMAVFLLVILFSFAVASVVSIGLGLIVFR